MSEEYELPGMVAETAAEDPNVGEDDSIWKKGTKRETQLQAKAKKRVTVQCGAVEFEVGEDGDEEAVGEDWVAPAPPKKRLTRKPGKEEEQPGSPEQKPARKTRTTRFVDWVDRHLPDEALYENNQELEQVQVTNFQHLKKKKGHTMIKSRMSSMMDCGEILGKASDPKPNPFVQFLKAIPHKLLLSFLGGIPAASVMVLPAFLPPYAVREKYRMDRDGNPIDIMGLTNFQQSLLERIIFCVIVLQGPMVCAPGLIVEDYAYDWKTYVYCAPFFQIPFFFLTLFLPYLFPDPDYMMFTIAMAPLLGGMALWGGAPLMFATSRMRGIRDWWDPRHILQRSIKGLSRDFFGILFFGAGCVMDILWILIDIVFLAPRTDWVMVARPFITCFVKKFFYITSARGAELCGDSIKIWGEFSCVCTLGINTAFAASQCPTWSAVFMFMVVDCFAFLSRLWCHSGKGNKTKIGFAYRKYLLFCKANPPTGVVTVVYRGFEIVLEGFGITIGYMTLIQVYLFSRFVLPNPMLFQLCFPVVDKSIAFLLTLFVFSLIQDAIAMSWVTHRCGYEFSSVFHHTFHPRNRMMWLAMYGVWWGYFFVTVFGWVFQEMQLGPFRYTLGMSNVAGGGRLGR